MSINKTLAILGGGQLGKMLLQKAADFNIQSIVIDPDADAPCKNLCSQFVNESFKNFDVVLKTCLRAEIVTVEIEHVNVEALFELEKMGCKVFPQPRILQMVNDKGLQKLFYKEHNIPTAEFYLVEDKSEIKKDVFPIIVKSRKGGYDGKGVMKLNDVTDIEQSFDEPALVEWCVDFEKEISVIVARNESGQIEHYPVVEMYFNPEANLVEMLFAPANISKDVEAKAIAIAHKLINELQMVGLLAVEMFVTKDGNVLVNEIAPRPHNSGHHTIEANITSQYEQHLRAIFNLPLGSTEMIRPAVMVNLLGEKGFTGEAVYEGLEEVLKMKSTYIHLYGKKITKPFRKMGHVTVCDDDLNVAIEKAKKVLEVLRVVA